MKSIKVLDCTLRDGGYVNNWEFGYDKIVKVVDCLTSAKIDIVECGFLTNKREKNQDSTQFVSIEEVGKVIPENKGQTKYVCMINYGEYDIDNIPENDGSSVNGIRVVFHHNRMNEALDFCTLLKRKGYLLFIQPMVTVNYKDDELLCLISRVNEIEPYAFYIVDSFGVIRRNEIMRLFYLIDNNLKETINLGYHSHNNLQLAYSNAQNLVELYSDRNLIIDSSVYGMGRGAGNLNTELFVEYLNEYMGTDYRIFPLLKIIDNILNKIYSINYWGYSLPFYLSAKYNCHPDYASYLSEKHSLTVESMDYLISRIPIEMRVSFNKQLISNMYFDYQLHYVDDTEALNKLEIALVNKRILIIAPGATIKKHYEQINQKIQEKDTVSICVNFVSENYKTNYAFICNEMRFEQYKSLLSVVNNEIIITSNIKEANNLLTVNYGTLRNNVEGVEDNAVLMLLKLLIRCNINNAMIAGFDGYEFNEYQNYAEKDMILGTKIQNLDMLNKSIKLELYNLSKNINLTFITPSKYIV